MSLHSIYKLYAILFLTCGFLPGIKLSYGQENFRFENFTSENGLSENVVYTIFQDTKGFLWIGTHDGLNRFDGYGFKKFRHDPSDNNSLPDNTIKCICEDAQGNIWLATNAGLCRYDPTYNKFTRIALKSKATNIQQVLAVKENELIINFNNDNINLINTNTLQEIPLGCNTPGGISFYLGSITPLSKDRNGNIYFANNLGGSIILWQYDSSSQSFVAQIKLPVEKKWQTEPTRFFFIDSRGHYWIAVNGAETLLYDPLANADKSKLLALKTALNLTNHINEDGEGNIWIATNAGLFYYEQAMKKMQRLHSGNPDNSISSDIVHMTCPDRTGIIWIGTSNGMNKLNPLQRKFRHIIYEKDSRAGLFNNFVLGIYPENDRQVRIHYNYWKPYFSRYDMGKRSARHYSVASYDYTSYIKEIVVKNPERLNDSILKKLVLILKKKIHGAGKPLGYLFIDKTADLWYGNWNSLEHANTSKHWDFDFLIADMKMYGEDIWLAINGGGLVCFNIPTQKFTRYTAGPIGVNGLNSNDITCFIIENNGDIWIGTKGGGLNFFDHEKKIFRHYTEENGLCNNSIYSMVKDWRGRLWLGTSYGLSCFDPLTNQFRNYFRSDGLVNSEFNRYSACKLSDGSLLMGGINGIDYFHPDSVINTRVTPEVQLTDFKVLGKSIYPGKKILLRHDQNYITIQFAAMDFSNPAGNKFAYKLEGADKNWISQEKINIASYSMLSPGIYQFLVKASNSDGTWNKEPATFSFTILPAWYQEWWFKAVIVLLIIAVVYFLTHYYSNRKLEKQRLLLEKQKAIDLERLRISNELHDDMGGELSAIHLLSEMHTSNINPQQQLSKISTSSGELVQRMNEIVWALNVNNDSLQGLIAYIRRYAVKYLDDVNIECAFDQPDAIPAKEIDGIARRNIFLLVKEALNNVVKHANATRVIIKVAIKGEMEIAVKDNGKGIQGDETQSETGNGLRNMQLRLKQLGGSMEIKNHDGTCLIFNIPLPGRNTKR